MAKEVPHLTGLRGIAALGVVCVHSAAMLPVGTPEIVKDFAVAGRQGVIVFFVLSAYTIALSLDGRDFTWKSYSLRRFFRIAPAYYAVLAILLVVGFQGSAAASLHTPYDFWSFLFHLSFLNFLDVGHAANAIGVETTISAEVFFYALLPFIIGLSRSRGGLIAMLLAVLVVAYLVPALWAENWSPRERQSWAWSPAPYALCFVIGAAVFVQRERIRDAVGKWAALLVPMALLLVLIYRPDSGQGVEIPYYCCVTILLILGGERPMGQLLMANRAARVLGKYSYSLYLVHLPILIMTSQFIDGWMRLPVALGTISAATFLLHHLAEVPGQGVVNKFRAPETGHEKDRANAPA